MGDALSNLHTIVAVCDDWGIGRDGDMIVANRADMRHFVRCTKGHTVIMGRKTLLSFPGGRPLKDRRNIVLSRDAAFAPEGVEVARSIDEALALLAPDEEAWVIGGGAVYRELLPRCATAVVTKNRCTRPADTFFPDLDEDPAWRLAATDGPYTIEPGEGDAGIAYEFATYEHVAADQGDGDAAASGKGRFAADARGDAAARRKGILDALESAAGLLDGAIDAIDALL